MSKLSQVYFPAIERGLIFSAILFTVLLWNPPTNSKTIKPTITASATELSRVAGVAKVVMKQAYWRAGYKLNVVCFPGRRALYKSNLGHVDAELVRIKSIGKIYPNLIRIQEPIFKVRGMAFVWNKNLSINSNQDLRGHRVGIVRGIQWAKEVSEGLSPKIASSAYDLFELLAKHTIDIALEADLTGQAVLHSFSGKGIVKMEKPLVQIPVYHYVHKNNRHLVEPLNRELEKMNRMAETDEIIHDLINYPTPPMC